MLRDLAFRLRALLRRRTVEQELDDELRFHLEAQRAKHEAAGVDPREAARRARLELGGLSYVKQECRDARGVSLLEDLVQDVRYGARKLRRSPGFTAIALLTLALGIGANSALFSLVSSVLIEPLPYLEPERLVTIHASKPNFDRGSISFPNFRDWRHLNRSFEAMAVERRVSFNLTGDGPAEQVRVRLVSSDFFPLLGVEPVRGRAFAAGEDEIGGAAVAVISAGFWQRRFGGEDVLGRILTLDGRPYTVVGIVPADFDLFRRGRPHEVYVPIGQWGNRLLSDRGAGLGIHGVGRLRRGVSIEQAQADMDRVTRHLAAVYPEDNRGIGAAVVPFEEDVVGAIRPTLLLLFGAVGFVLLIACVNVANLLLARTTARTRELAIRVALGAGRRRLLRQLLTESMLLALVGGAIGLGLAVWATPAALAMLPDALPRASDVALDGRVLLFTTLVSMASGLLFGLVPSLKLTGARLQGALRDGGRGSSGARHRAQDLFVVAQVAMVLVMLVGAGLMVRSLSRLLAADPGFEPARVTSLGVSLPPSMMTAGPEATRAHLRQIEARVNALPGVEAVSLSLGALPFIEDDQQLFWKEGQPAPASSNEMSWALWYVVGPEYRRAMGIPLLAGRFLEPSDDEGSARVAVVDDVFARQYFGADDPIGKVLHLDGHDRPVEIVGVVGHVVQWGLDRDASQPLRAQLYFPVMQLPDTTIAPRSGLDLFVRSTGPAPYEAIRRALQEMNPDQVGFSGATMDQVISRTLAARRFSMTVLAAFAALALLLAVVGIYGVVSYGVNQRVGEIGIRTALGARRGDVLRLVLGHGLRMTLAGVALGLVAGLSLTHVMAHMLYGVSATDPWTFATVALGLTAVALAACYLPARRALRVDPMNALRHE